MGDSPASSAGFGRLRALIAEQKENYRRYFLILQQENGSFARGDDGKAQAYRKLEVDGREKIVATNRSLRELEPAAAWSAEEKAELAAGRAALEELRLKALEENALARLGIGRQLDEVKKELTAVGAVLRRHDGGRAPSEADPVYIDFYS